MMYTQLFPCSFVAQILPLDEEFTSSQALPWGIHVEKKYIYNVCGWWGEYWAQGDWVYNFVPELRGNPQWSWCQRVRRRRSCLLCTYKSFCLPPSKTSCRTLQRLSRRSSCHLSAQKIWDTEGRNTCREGRHCGMSARIWRQACMCADNSLSPVRPFTWGFHPRFLLLN